VKVRETAVDVDVDEAMEPKPNPNPKSKPKPKEESAFLFHLPYISRLKSHDTQPAFHLRFESLLQLEPTTTGCDARKHSYIHLLIYSYTHTLIPWLADECLCGSCGKQKANTCRMRDIRFLPPKWHQINHHHHPLPKWRATSAT